MLKAHRYYVYILKCSDDSLYTGVTNNLELRIKQHQKGVNTEAYTYSRRPFKVVFYEEFKYIDKAIAFEKQIKGWTRRKKQAMIEGNWDKVKVYAKCLNDTASSRSEKE